MIDLNFLEILLEKACCDKLVRVAAVVEPEPELAAKNEARYQQFKKIYPACKQLFPLLQ